MDIEEQYDKIYRYCYFKLYDDQIAQDITQETFLRFCKQGLNLGSDKELPYLYTIAKNLCIDHFRQRTVESLGEITEEMIDDPTFFVVDECGEHNLGRYDRRVNPEVVTDCFDGSVTGQRMVGEQLFFLNTNGIGTQLCQWSRGSSVRPLLSTDDYLIDFDTHDGQHFFFVATIGLSLPEVYFWDGGALQQLTYLNENVFSEKSLCQPEAFSFQTRDGIGIDGFILKPLGYQPGHSYPGILHIHGGPKMVFGPGFHHEMQLWASNGYFVCYCNPRGSCGKGNAFANLQEKYGTIDFQDLMDFTDEVFRRYPDLDCQRMGVVGGSYGGFMTNWIIGHTNRFRCAVSQRGIANYMSDYLLSDIGISSFPLVLHC